MLLVAMPGAPFVASLLLVVRPGAPSSFLVPVVIHAIECRNCRDFISYSRILMEERRMDEHRTTASRMAPDFDICNILLNEH